MSDPQTPAVPPERPDRGPSDRVVSLDGAQTGDVSIGDVAGGDIYKTTVISQARLSPAEQQAQRNRAALLGLVRRFWVEGVLHESLHQRVLIEVGMQTRTDAVDHPWRNIVRLPGQAPQPLAPGQPISAVFVQAGRRLLILGAPGGGKTTTLLSLAEQLIGAAEGDSSLPTPVLFQLSTWAVARPALADWLVTELKERYKVPPKVGKAWVEAGEILPLLDGLDEVGPSDTERAACVQAINAYLGESGAQAAVCSRTAEYARLGAQLSLDTAVEIQPLEPGQVDGYLARFGPPLAGLRQAVAEDATLGNLAASPLLLSVMALAYRDTPAADLVGQRREAAYQRLWADYMRDRFALERADARTDPHQLRAWLIWLARGMLAHGQQVFYIENLQPSWLATAGQRRAFHWLSGLAGGLAIGLGIVLGVGLVGALGVALGVVRDAVLGVILVIGLILGLIYGLIFSLRGIKLTETLSWDWSRIYDRSRLFDAARSSLAVGLIGGLAFGLGGGLVGGLGGGLAFGLVVGLAGGVVVGMMNIFFQEADLKISMEPNEGIRRSRTNMRIGSLVIGLSGGLLYGLLYGLFYGPLVGLLIGLTGGTAGALVGLFQYGGEAVLKHALLCRQLQRRCRAPRDFAAALDEAVSRTLMTRVGGGYRFYHRLLQEHFAEHERPELPIAPIIGPPPGE